MNGREAAFARVLEVNPGASPPSVLAIAGSRTFFADLPAGGLPGLVPGDFVRLEQGGAGPIVASRIPGPAAGCTLDPLGDALRWRRPGARRSRMDVLWQRQTILAAVRAWFADHGFLEVETPLRVRGTCPDAFLDSVRVEDGDRYLVTSTEYQLKRLIAGGFERVYTLTRNFRAGDVGEVHNPEFTMLEWARVDVPLDRIEADAEGFVAAALDRLEPGARRIRTTGGEVDVRPPWRRLTVREALRDFLGVAVPTDFDPEATAAAAIRAGLDVPPGFATDGWALFAFLVDAVQPRLGQDRPVFLRDWPSFLTSSAGGRDAATADRSELFIAGVEVADGFPSERDADVQRRRFERQNAARIAQGKAPVAVDDRYLEALAQGLPPGAGMALGVDRLVMLLTGCTTLREVTAFVEDEL